MITVDFLCTERGVITGFRVAGHAEFSGAGSDIVCAAVSSAVYMVMNTATDVLQIAPLGLRAGEGEAFFRVQERDEPSCKTLLAGLKLHLLGLEEQYPKNMKVSYLEI